MITLWMRRLCAACALLSALSVFPAAAEVPVPPLTARVTDLTGTLSASEQAELERTLADFEARKGSQIAVLMVPTTEPETIEQYSMRVVEQWKLGRKKVEDGALLLIAKDDRTLRIEVGYGLEGALSDIVSKRIISEDIVPHLRKGDFAAGIRAGVDRMMRVMDGETLPPPSHPPRQDHANAGGPSQDNALLLIFFFAVIGGGFLRAMLGPLPGALATGGLVALGTWLLLGAFSLALIAGLIAAVATLTGVGGGGFGGGFRGGGGFGGSSGGGGFSGGGGGFG
ncbi:MAG TPA: YgcG family protein, partial [Rhodocyclaceae bacterium]|nr:YgcG family protein [Rhodocyclaceae bacterium]